jgi:hypothetical protein
MLFVLHGAAFDEGLVVVLAPEVEAGRKWLRFMYYIGKIIKLRLMSFLFMHGVHN